MIKLFIVPISWKILKAFFAPTKQVIQDTQCLNVYIKGSTDHEFREVVYSMKDRMTAWFYKAGYCKDVLVTDHVLMCNSYRYHGPHGDRSPEHCPKCRGTGIYKTTNLYLYRFEYGDLKWGWHQPKERALIIPAVSMEAENPEDSMSRYMLGEYGDIEQRFWNAYIFILLRGWAWDLDLTREFIFNFKFIIKKVQDSNIVKMVLKLSRKFDPDNDIPF